MGLTGRGFDRARMQCSRSARSSLIDPAITREAHDYRLKQKRDRPGVEDQLLAPTKTSNEKCRAAAVDESAGENVLSEWNSYCASINNTCRSWSGIRVNHRKGEANGQRQEDMQQCAPSY